MPASPEIDKLNSEAMRHRITGEFIEWLSDNDFTICERVQNTGWGTSTYVPTPMSLEQLLARYLEIDLNKVEDERRAYLAWHRAEVAAQEAKT
jgi:hypothetical protein